MRYSDGKCDAICSNKTASGYCNQTVCSMERIGTLNVYVQPTLPLQTIMKPKTNADRIRSMSDEELADELLTCFSAFYDVEWSRQTVLEWLKEEA